MKHLINKAVACTIIGAAPLVASAGDISECELLLVQIIASEDGSGQAQVPTYVPAEAYFASLNDDKDGHMTEMLGHKIQAIMCRRNDVIPTDTDYETLATGIPFILSQDFDSPDTDSLTLYWKEGRIETVYKGYPLSEEAEAILETRLEAFSKHGLNKWAIKQKKTAQKIKAETHEEPEEDETQKEKGEDRTEVIITTETEDITTELEAEDKPKIESQKETDLEANTEPKIETEIDIETEVEITE